MRWGRGLRGLEHATGRVDGCKRNDRCRRQRSGPCGDVGGAGGVRARDLLP